MNVNNINEVFTMDDIAAELGISKSTVSRALAGSNRISQATKDKVNEFAKLHGFKPNMIAKALAGQKTFNIAAVMPFESTNTQMMYYHESLSGMTRKFSEQNYSVLLCMTDDDETDVLEDAIRNRKADGFILTQLKKNDKKVELLKNANIPFVVIGSGAGEGVIQVDSKMKESCSQFAKIFSKRVPADGNVLFVCGSLEVEANNNRLSGFLDAMKNCGIDEKHYTICTNENDIDSCVCVGSWNLILCADDIVCARVLDSLKIADIKVGKDLMLASFYDSVLLELSNPSVSALKVDSVALGAKAAEIILKKLSGESVEEMNYVDCSFNLRESTEF